MKNAFLDFDGTIVSVFERFQKILEDYIGANHIKSDQYILLKRSRVPDSTIAEVLYSKRIPCLDDYLLFKHKQLEIPKYLSLDTLIPGSFEALYSLSKGGYRIVLLTQRQNRDNLLWQIERLSLADWFSQVITVSPLQGTLAKAEAVKKLSTVDDIIIGDSPNDILCAKQLGIFGCFVETGLWSASAANIEKNVFPSCVEATRFALNHKRD